MIYHFLYIIQSVTSGSYYVGTARDINIRLKQHNLGKVSSTQFYRPWILRYKEKCSDLSSARKREKQIKGWKSRKAIERLFN